MLRSSFDPKYLEPDVDKEGNIISRRKYRIPIKGITTKAQHKALMVDKKHVKVPIKVIDKSKFVAVDWKNRPKDIVLHHSPGTYTIKNSGGDYSSLTAWEADNQGDLVAQGGICVAECYDDFTNGLVDSLIIDGWTTDTSNYVRVFVPLTERHNGTTARGFQLIATAYNGVALVNNVNHTRVEGLILKSRFR